MVAARASVAAAVVVDSASATHLVALSDTLATGAISGTAVPQGRGERSCARRHYSRGLFSVDLEEVSSAEIQRPGMLRRKSQPAVVGVAAGPEPALDDFDVIREAYGCDLG